MRHLYLGLLLLLLTGCWPGKITLTDDVVKRYIAAVADIRQAAPGVAGELKSGGGLPGGKAGLRQVERAAKAHGFKGAAEFTRVNTSISWAYGQATAGGFADAADDNVKRAVAAIDAQLANPVAPESTKVELRTQRARLLKTYATSKGWMDTAKGWLSPLSDEKALAVVKRHIPELNAVYLGR